MTIMMVMLFYHWNAEHPSQLWMIHSETNTKGVFVWGRWSELPKACLMTVSQKEAWLNSAEVSLSYVS